MKVTKIKPAFVSEPFPPPVEERMEVPAGGIVMYTGSSAPTGFEKVEGLAFVMVSGSTAVNKTPTTDNLASHEHTIPASSNDPAHTHSMSAGNVSGGGGTTYYGFDFGGTATVAPAHEHTVGVTSQSSGAHNHPAGTVGAPGLVQVPFRILNFIKNTSGNLAVAPIGSIVMFDGALSSIPDGWAICDGNNGTVNMRERFSYGTTGNGNLLESGGSKTHTHPAVTVGTAGKHTHTFSISTGKASGISGETYSSSAGGQYISTAGHRHSPEDKTTNEEAAHAHTYPAVSADHMPLYVYLYYIQRIS